jgi:hypothetical protein
MSLIQLLSVGRSFSNGQDLQNPYKVTQGFSLPKFGDVRPVKRKASASQPAGPAPNALKLQAAAEAEAKSAATGSPAGRSQSALAVPEKLCSEAQSPSVAEASSPSAGPAGENGCDSAPEDERHSSGTSAASAHDVPTNSFPNPVTYPLGRWTSLTHLLVRHESPKRSAEPVQGEFCLDAVKVVRNDLHDADVELVPAKAPATASTRRSSDEIEAGTVVWPEVLRRLFRASKLST